MDGNSFDFNSVPYVRDAMKAKKYAFAADYIRLYALYTEGGIYLDFIPIFVSKTIPAPKHPFSVFKGL